MNKSFLVKIGTDLTGGCRRSRPPVSYRCTSMCAAAVYPLSHCTERCPQNTHESLMTPDVDCCTPSWAPEFRVNRVLLSVNRVLPGLTCTWRKCCARQAGLSHATMLACRKSATEASTLSRDQAELALPVDAVGVAIAPVASTLHITNEAGSTVALTLHQSVAVALAEGSVAQL
jgi:hypothetical protein